MPEYIPADVLTLFVFLLGTCVGSFLNVCIYRLPAGKSIVRPGSHCFACGAMVRWYDNIPVLSYILLGGRCRSCGERFSARYALVELLCGVLFALAFWRAAGLPCAGTAALFFLVFVSWLVAITFIDIDHLIIPDEFSLSGVALGLLFNFLCPSYLGAGGGLGALGLSALGAFGSALTLYLVGVAGTAVFRKEALGFGDVKLIAMIGAFLGLKLAFLALFFSAVSGTAVALLMIAAGRAGFKDEIPYGPYLALGAFSAFMWGRELLVWYVGLLGPAFGS